MSPTACKAAAFGLWGFDSLSTHSMIRLMGRTAASKAVKRGFESLNMCSTGGFDAKGFKAY